MAERTARKDESPLVKALAEREMDKERRRKHREASRRGALKQSTGRE